MASPGLYGLVGWPRFVAASMCIHVATPWCHDVVQEDLNDIDDQRAAHAGVFASRPLMGEAPAGQAVCAALLNLW